MTIERRARFGDEISPVVLSNSSVPFVSRGDHPEPIRTRRKR